MELLIFVSMGIAFGALLVVIWKNAVELKEKTDRLALAEARLNELTGERPAQAEAPAPAAGGDAHKIALLEKNVADLEAERRQLLTELAEARESLTRKERTAGEGAQLAGKLAQAEAENARLRDRVARLEEQANGQRDTLARLQATEARVVELERGIDRLEREKSEALDRLKDLEALGARVPELENAVAGLSRENERLVREAADFHASLRDRIQSQLDHLREIHQDLTTRAR
ncbi:MAG TPA: hypothetical protein VNN77_01470 [candidate division Zixibacteria bacterium]|nr:hypothetical protein [candidate division Zixibacteria bacterium]